MESLYAAAVARIVRSGTLVATFASGRSYTFGDGSGERLAVRFTDAAAQRAIAIDPQLKFGEMFMEGRLVVEQGTVYDVLALLKRNGGLRAGASHLRLLEGSRIARARTLGTLRPDNAKRNVAHHYDLDAGLFELFLDEDRQYSCAYFESPDDSIEQAQQNKKRHIAAKLLLQPGAEVLDIGCGWGGLGLYLAETSEARVTGITLSEEQLKIARGRAERRGLTDRVEFRLDDYRSVTGVFDRIVSVGMFEHVGTRNYATYFRKAAALLEPETGVMLLHSIGRDKPAHYNQPFIEKYIFPGGYIPALSEVLPAAEQAGLLVTDIEILPMHYAWTLRAWRERFMSNRARAVELYDERFCRMWEFYLAASQTGFEYDNLFVFQMQLARRHAAVPMRRDYIGKAEAELAARGDQLHLSA